MDETERGGDDVRRLTRDPDNKVVGGVAAGMATYFGVDPVLMRLIWVLLIFTGVGVPGYIVAWIAIPEGPSGGSDRSPSRDAEGVRLLLGAVLILVGVGFLVRRFAPWLDDIALPALLIALGAGVLVYGWKR